MKYKKPATSAGFLYLQNGYIFLEEVLELLLGQKGVVTLPKNRTVQKSIITETQIVKAIQEYEGGREQNDICRELGIHKSTFYNWRKKYAGIDSQELKRLKELESLR